MFNQEEREKYCGDRKLIRISLLPKWSSGQVNWRTSSKSAFTFFEYKKILIRVLVH